MDTRIPPDELLRDLLSRDYHWSARQREVLDLVAHGKSNQDIADQLGISLDGAKWHIREIFARLGVDSREEAAEYWRARNGLRLRFTRLLRSLGVGAPWAKAVLASAVLVVVAVAATTVVIALRQDDGQSFTATAITADPTPDVKATDAARRSPTATPIPPETGPCPPGIDAAACQAARDISAQPPSSLVLKAVTANCPPADAWLIGMEPLCAKVDAGKPKTGFSTGVKQWSFVDEATFRTNLVDWLNGARHIAGIACPRASETAELDCSAATGILLQSADSRLTLVFATLAGSTPVTFGARSGLLPKTLAGGWISTVHPGLEKYLPERMWLIPWQP
jgi:DNA-binding CsgD family transcriptional regulator